MQDRMWNYLANVKFKALYTVYASRRAYNFGNYYSLFLAVASASSVSAWAFWDRYPLVWAFIIGVAQVLHIAKPYIPFVKGDRELMEISLQYELLYLSYEKLWFDSAKESSNGDSIEKRFYACRDKEHDINTRFKHIMCPEINSLINRADTETDQYLQTNF